MNLKLFYSPPKWKAFIAPEKPRPVSSDLVDGYTVAEYRREKYEKAYAEAKANALEVANYGEIYTIVNDNLDREITLPCTEIDGVEYFDWPGSAVVRDNKYYLEMRSKIAKRILDETPQEVRDEVKAYGDRVVSGDDDIYYLTGPDEFVKGEPNRTEQERIEKDAEAFVFNHAHDPFGLSKQECYEAGANATRLRYIEALKELIAIAEYYHNNQITYTEMPYKNWRSAIERAKSLIQ